MFSFLSNKKDIENQQKEEFKFHDDNYKFDMLLLKIRQVCGIDLEVKKTTIRPKLIKFCTNNNLSSFSQLTNKMDLNLPIRQELFDLITVCETYFYRELKQLNELIYILRAEPSKRRILCAPSSSGEEVYSILMLANEAGITNLSILGIDINAEIIQKARARRYSKRSLYNLNDNLIKKYFDQDNDEYVIKSQYFSNAKFEVVNVFDKKFLELGKFDVILSRNMMIYFNEEYKYRLVDNFVKNLNDGGMFFAGHADLVPSHNELKKVYANTCTYYVKE
ncbi:CheR family methyltransferase [Campylobacter sp. RM12647]|uniref:CheR family methyltransferase n=1 Tax=Campylobacter sp. RM12647 TaxID=2735737 RepID=UPI001D61A066|nr:protein-glutamate O-methyltransferase CheR [Campylobacter sp. RM12647]